MVGSQKTFCSALSLSQSIALGVISWWTTTLPLALAVWSRMMRELNDEDDDLGPRHYAIDPALVSLTAQIVEA